MVAEVDEDVRGFDVTMHDPVPVGTVQCIGNGRHDFGGGGKRERTPFHFRRQVTPLDVFGNDETQAVVRAAAIVYRDNRVVFQPREDLRFAQVGFDVAGLGDAIAMRNLDGDVPSQIVVKRQINASEAAVPQHAEHAIAADFHRRDPVANLNRGAGRLRVRSPSASHVLIRADRGRTDRDGGARTCGRCQGASSARAASWTRNSSHRSGKRASKSPRDGSNPCRLTADEFTNDQLELERFLGGDVGEPVEVGLCRERHTGRPAADSDRARRGPPSRRASVQGAPRQIQKCPAAQSHPSTVRRTVPKQPVRLTHRHRSSWVTMLRNAGPARSSAGPQPRGESRARIARRDRGVIQRPLTVDCCLDLTRAICPMQSGFQNDLGVFTLHSSPKPTSAGRMRAGASDRVQLHADSAAAKTVFTAPVKDVSQSTTVERLRVWRFQVS